jgi:hypothetical protein
VTGAHDRHADKLHRRAEKRRRAVNRDRRRDDRDRRLREAWQLSRDEYREAARTIWRAWREHRPNAGDRPGRDPRPRHRPHRIGVGVTDLLGTFSPEFVAALERLVDARVEAKLVERENGTSIAAPSPYLTDGSRTLVSREELERYVAGSGR